jgi:hypothetical protein
MTVYVDSVAPCQPNAKWRHRESCHMFADTHDELMDMARRMGLRPAWLQSAGTHTEHFDLTENRRRQAIGYGAVSVTRRDMGNIILGKTDAKT